MVLASTFLDTWHVLNYKVMIGFSTNSFSEVEYLHGYEIITQLHNDEHVFWEYKSNFLLSVFCDQSCRIIH